MATALSNLPRTTQPTPPRPVPKKVSQRVRWTDKIAGHVIRFGGGSVILAVAAIFLFIGKESLPLFLPAQSNPWLRASLPSQQMHPAAPFLGMDEYETYAYWLDPAGHLAWARLNEWTPLPSLPIPELQGATITTAYRTPSKDHLLLGTEDGRLFVTQVKFRPVYRESGRTIEYRIEEGTWMDVSPNHSPVLKVFGRYGDSGLQFAASCQDGRLYVGHHEAGEDPRLEEVTGLPKARVRHLALDADGDKLFVALEDGRLLHYYLQEDLEKPFAILAPGHAKRAITAMEFLIGENSLLLGFSDGAVEQWFGVREKEDQYLLPYRKIRSFRALPAPVRHLLPSGRDRGFLAASEDGTIELCYTTSRRSLLRWQVASPVSGLVYSPKLTSLLARTGDGIVRGWTIDNPHPDISWKTLFGKVWYEGYSKPDYIWQSTGGSDDFESKLSLVPLTFGTLKGAFYGLIFAIPVAVLGAIYTSQFMHRRLRTVVKPAVEIMAALPSVVIGFLAGLWLAPLLEHHLISVALMILLIPGFILGLVLAWNQCPLSWRDRLPNWTELALISLAVMGGFFVALQLGPPAEAWLFQGDLHQWVFANLDQQFEQRNSIVIGFAMGFAVIPIIFTISEDALSNVPRHFISGSLALGASPWQTALRVILPTASPGIFSAVMVGFGRAVGETMIVLMATGNTPILSLSPFNGMRTLSANVAVEIPEAPVDSTLYRILFLTAILLFALTFAVNTVAEIIRQRLREKYKAV